MRLPGSTGLFGAFGFEKKAVYMGSNDSVAHAELTFGNGMIMAGSVTNEGEHGKLMVQPDEIGLRETRGIYIVVPDADVVYTKAKAAGAEMVMDIRDMEYGGRAFTCRDIEGHLWTVGSYDPWQTATE